MSQLVQKTLGEISTKHIKPLPRWHAQGKNGVFWIGSSLLAVSAAFATTLCFHVLFEIDWDVYGRRHFSWWEVLFSGVPVFALGAILLFLLGGIFLWHQTKHGYRYPLVLMFAILFGVSSVTGYLIEVLPFDSQVDRFLLQPVRHVEKWRPGLLPSAVRQWSQPEKGLLGGTIVTVWPGTFDLRDAQNALWVVDSSSAILMSGVHLDPKMGVKVIGTETAPRKFRAEEIRNWEAGHSEKMDRNE